MTATAKSAKATASDSTNQVVRDALRYYEEALKSGIQLQEDCVKLWKDLLDQVGSPDGLRRKLEEMATEALPRNRQRMEDVAALFQQSASQCADLLGKAASVYQAGSVTEAQARLQDLVKSSLSALRNNVHAVVDTNTKIMKSWDDMLSRK